MAETMARSDLSFPVDVRGIMSLIPHRYPFLLVDTLTSIEGDTAKGYKNVTVNEPFFQGHFPGNPIMPGVLMLEGLAQCACAFYAMKYGLPEDKLIVFASIDKAKFRNQVVPSNRLDYDITLTTIKEPFIKFEAKASVDGNVAVTANMMAAVVDKPKEDA